MDSKHLHINTGLDGFILLNGIRRVNQTRISAWTRFNQDHEYLGIEALAQLGAIHARYLCDFEQHAFLMKINFFDLVQQWDPALACDLQADLLVKTQSALRYQLSAQTNGRKLCFGQFSFGLVEYDQRFQKHELKAHYKRIFTCLSHSTNE